MPGPLTRLSALLPFALILASCAGEERAGNETAAAVRIAPGLWEIQSAVTAAQGPNLPILIRDRLVGPRPTRRLCITPGQAAAAQPGATPGTIILRSAYEAQRYALRLALAERMPDGSTLRLEIVTAGRRIGDCREGGRR